MVYLESVTVERKKREIGEKEVYDDDRCNFEEN